ncbi:unnamed protein product [Vicia faba]|uniref:Acetyl-CoA carboxylase n=1 Tax=Vicia faba TaxID=3906 RepID=A0AAV0YN93_VICFA|nr:unnamed protein product [Vicia faba]
MLPQRMKKAVTDNPKKLANLIDLVNLPPTLRDFVGQSQTSRLTCFMRIWSYVKTNNLQENMDILIVKAQKIEVICLVAYINLVIEPCGTRLLIDGRTCLLQNDHDPSKLIGETPCKLLRYLVADDSHIDADTPYAEVEVMKMCMPLLSPASGIIHFRMAEGQAMQAGELIARLDLDDPSAVRKAEPFTGSFPILGPPTAISGKVHQKCATSLNAARMIFAGYEHNIDEVVQSLLNCLDSPELPFLQWQECFAVLATRLPKYLRIELEAKYKEFEINSSSQNIDFPAKLLKGILEDHFFSCADNEKGALERLVEPLMSLSKNYLVIIQADVIERLRLQYKKDLLKIVDIVLSHQGVKSKNKLILRLMDKLLALKASQLLEQTKLSELRSSIARSLSELEMFTEDGENIDTPKRKGAINDRMEDLVSAPLAVEDALVGLFDHSDNTLQRRVVETYIRRLYQPYLVKGSIMMQWHISGLIATWEFLEEYVERKNGVEDKTLAEKHSEKKWGVMVVIKSLQFLPAIISAALREATNNFHDALKSGSVDSNKHGNMMHIGLVGINNQMSLLQDSGDEDQAQERINKLAKILREQEVGSIIHAAGVGDISCIIQRDEGRAPMRHSFHWSAEKLYYEEEPLLRHLEPPLSIYLELDKLKGYENIRYTPSRDRQWHLYTVVDTKPQPIQRMFLRTLLRQPTTNEGYSAYQRVDAETSRTQLDMSFTSRSIFRSLMGAMEELELNSHNTTIKSEHAHMYLYVLREQQVDDLVHYSKKINIDAGQEETTVETILEKLEQEIHSSVGVRMHRLGVFVWEVKLWITACGQANGAWRVIVNNVTGHTSTVHIYREMEDATTHKVVYSSVTVKGPLHGVPVNENYQPLGVIDRKRLAVRKSSTTYCYDFPLAFQTSLEQSWSIQQTGVQRAKDKDLLKLTELKFSEKEGSWGTSLVPAECPPGLNDAGMVAWLMEMCTPEFPSGRTILVVSNDVTFKAGSFGPREDAFFRAVTDLACAKKIPLHR